MGARTRGAAAKRAKKEEQPAMAAAAAPSAAALPPLPAEALARIMAFLPPCENERKWGPRHTECLPRVQAGMVCKRWREASLACEWDLALDLPLLDPQPRLDAFLAWARARRVAALTLRAPRLEGAFLPPVDRLLCLAGLGRLPHLARLDLSLGVPHDLTGLGGCARLAELTVALPDFEGYEYRPGEEDGEDYDEAEPIYRDELRDCARTSGAFTLALAASHYLGGALARLGALQRLDVHRAVPPRGLVRVEGATLPLTSALPWLPQLSQLTRLAAAAPCMTGEVWALPALRVLSVHGQAWERAEGEAAVERHARVDLACLAQTGAHLSRVVLSECEVAGTRYSLGPALRELSLVYCRVAPKLRAALAQQVRLSVLGGAGVRMKRDDLFGKLASTRCF